MGEDRGDAGRTAKCLARRRVTQSDFSRLGDERASSTEISRADVCADRRYTVKNDSSLGGLGVQTKGTMSLMKLIKAAIKMLRSVLPFK